jgi:hypothetical protein
MYINSVIRVLFISLTMTAFCAAAVAEKTVYKWVDEDGVVHFGDAPPVDAIPGETETITIPKSPANVSPARPVASPATVSSPAEETPTAPQVAETPLLFEKMDITKMSVADLSLRCDEAREKMIAPLREAEIAKCKQDKREDPAFCERFNADYGEGGRNINGSMRPRMFDDLPECVEALQEKNRRGR